MKIKTTALAIAALAMLAGGRAAADGMPSVSLKDAPRAPIWSGFHFGAGVGYGHLVAENDYWEPGFASSWKGEGAAGGLATFVVGFDRQLGDRYVAGLFGEYEWSSIEITYEDTTTPQQTFRLQSAISLGARAGFLLTPTSLLYVTGGYTWAEGNSDRYFDITEGATTYPGVTSLTLDGPFAGIGMETRLSERLGLRGEVRYVMFRDQTTNNQPSVPFTDSFHANLLTGRLVVVYKMPPR
jgi:outer membrane immunogenic protein